MGLLKNHVYVEKSNGEITGIIDKHRYLKLPPDQTGIVRKTVAVSEIRKKVFEISQGECKLCGSPVTWESGHMHEIKLRSLGGKISTANSIFICPACHQNEHKDRRWQTGILDDRRT